MGSFKRGTPGWAIEKFKEQFLPALLSDLEKKEESGLMDQVCNRVQKALHDALQETSRYPKLFADDESIETELRSFNDLYFKWNNHPKDHLDLGRKHRRDRLKELRERRERIRDTTKKHLHVLAEKTDEKCAMAVCQSLAKLGDELPDSFPTLANAAKLFDRRRR